MNNGKRPSHFLSRRGVERMFDAGFRAYCIGRPLTCFVTIHCESGGISSLRIRGFITAYLKSAGDWLRYQGCPLCFVWTLENIGGLHLHLLIHLPRELKGRFLKRQMRWVRKAGLQRKKGAVVSEDIYFSDPFTDDYLPRGLLGALRYIAKGIEPLHADHFGIEHEPQGPILGKRSGIAQQLTSATRPFFPAINRHTSDNSTGRMCAGYDLLARKLRDGDLQCEQHAPLQSHASKGQRADCSPDRSLSDAPEINTNARIAR